MKDQPIIYGTDVPFPYHIEYSNSRESMEVVRTKAGGFHVFRYGKAAPLLVGVDYFLVKDPLTSYA